MTVAQDRADTLAILASYRERLVRRRTELEHTRIEEQTKFEQLKAVAARRAQEYRSTPQGIAESLRELETAQLSGRDRATLRQLQRNHVAAETVSIDEYQTRRNRWGHKPGDGPVRGCPVGTNTDIALQIIRHKLFGSYRHDPDAHAVRIGLFRITAQSRLRTSVTFPLGGPLRDNTESIDLCTILTWSFSQGALSDRVLTRLKLDPELWLPLMTAHAAASTALAD